MGILNQRPLATDPEAVGWVSDCLDAMKAMDQKIVLLAFFGKGDLKGKPGMQEAAVRALKQLAPKAEKLGKTLGLESYLNMQEHLKIIDAVGSDALKVYYDVANMAKMGYDIYQEMEQLGNQKLICQVHLKENGVRLGSGVVDFNRSAGHLKRSITEAGSSPRAGSRETGRKANGQTPLSSKRRSASLDRNPLFAPSLFPLFLIVPFVKVAPMKPLPESPVFLPGTSIEIVRPAADRSVPRHVLFDFDGTLSLIREGWPEVMIPMMVEHLADVAQEESPEELTELVEGVRHGTDRQADDLPDDPTERGDPPARRHPGRPARVQTAIPRTTDAANRPSSRSARRRRGPPRSDDGFPGPSIYSNDCKPGGLHSTWPAAPMKTTCARRSSCWG